MIARSRLDPKRSVSRSTARSCSRESAHAGGGSTFYARDARRWQRARGKQRGRGCEREIHRRRGQTTVDQPPAPVTEHRPPIILASRGKERLELTASGHVSDELAHPAPIAGAGSSGQGLTTQPRLVLVEKRDRLAPPRILSEPPDGRLAPSASPLSAVLCPNRLCGRQDDAGRDHGGRPLSDVAVGRITVRARRASSGASRRSARLGWCGIPR
jgi:hypothetical protein